MISRIKRRLAYKLILSILLFSAIITLISTAVQLYVDYKKDLEGIDEQLAQIETSFIKSLSSLMWLYNNELIHAQLEGIVQLQDIVHVEVWDNQKIVASIGDHSDDAEVIKDFPLTYHFDNQLRKLGKVRVFATYAGVYDRLFEQMLVNFLSSAVKTFVTAFFMLFLFQVMVMRHLRRIATYLQSYSLNEDAHPLRLNTRETRPENRDELTRIESDVNTLIDSIRDAYEMAQEMVRKRTQELEEANIALTGEIAERTQLLDQLKQSERNYKNLVDNSPGILYRYSKAQGGFFVSNRVESILGYSAEYLMAHPFVWSDSIHPEDRAWVDRAIADGIEGRGFDIEYRIKDKEGHWHWFRDRSITVFGEEETPTIEGLALDITERKLAFDALIESEQKYRRVVDSAPVGIFKSTMEGRLLETNPRLAEILGYDSPQDLLKTINQTSIAEVLYPDPDYRSEVVNRVKSRQGWVEQENEYRRKDGSIVICATMFRYHEKQDGTQIIEGFIRDITEEKRLHEAIIRSEENYRSLFMTSPLGIFQSTPSGKYRMVNPYFAQMLGFESPRQMIDTVDNIAEMYVDQSQRDQVRERLAEQGELNAYEIHLRRIDGRKMWMSIYVKAVYDNQGEIDYYSGYTIDITEQKQVEESLEKSEKQYETLVNTMYEGVIVQDTRGQIIANNPAAEKVLGIENDLMEGKNPGHSSWRVIDENRNPFPAERYPSQLALNENRSVRNVMLGIEKPDKRIVWLNINAEPIRQKDSGAPYSVVSTFTDITELKEAEEELKRSNRELEQFAYVASHDLKSPLRAIHNYADFLKEDLGDHLEGEQLTYLQGLGKAVNEAEVLVNDLLNLSRIGRKESGLQQVDIGRLLDEIIQLIPMEENVEFTKPEYWPEMLTQVPLMKQVLYNLINNAIMYNKSSPKTITVGWNDIGEKTIEIFIADNGIGIDKQHHDRIFGIFERLHSKSEFQGTGVGLAIVKKALTYLQGSIRLTSQPGEGSTFFIKIPKQPATVT